MTDAERLLLERLADAGKPTPLREDELLIAQVLESSGLVLMIPRAGEAMHAVIMPRGRSLIASGEEPKSDKNRFGFR